MFHFLSMTLMPLRACMVLPAERYIRGGGSEHASRETSSTKNEYHFFFVSRQFPCVLTTSAGVHISMPPTEELLPSMKRAA